MKNITVSLDDSGHLLLPEAIREAAGLNPGMVLEIRYRNGRVEIEPPAPKMRIVEKRGVYVATPEEPLKPLTAEMVRETQETLRARYHEG